MTEPRVVETSISGGVGRILLNRPEAMNAITIALGAQLREAVLDLAPQVSVIVISGAGGNFCVGGDFRELGKLRELGTDAMAQLFDHFASACAAIAEVDVPVISAVEGHAMAGGFELMQASDIVLVSDNARVADTHTNHAQIPGGGSTQRLPRLVGRQRALGHILSGDRLSSAELVEWGLAYRSFPAADFQQGVADFAAALAAKSRPALSKVKRLVYAGLQVPLAEGLSMERRSVLAHLSGDGAGSGITAFTKSDGTAGGTARGESS